MEITTNYFYETLSNNVLKKPRLFKKICLTSFPLLLEYLEIFHEKKIFLSFVHKSSKVIFSEYCQQKKMS